MARPRSSFAALLRRYGAADITAARPVDEGLLNQSYAVDTDLGRFFLKQYLDQKPAQIHAQHTATAALAAAGLPVAAPLADLRGRTVNRHRSRIFGVYPWIEGGHRPGLTLGAADCRDLGRLLARFHEELVRILGPADQPLFLPTVSAADALATSARLLALIRERPDREGIDDLAEFRLCERRGLLHAFADHQPAEDAVLSVGYVHGDFHGLNVLYAPDGAIRAVVDWDRLGVHPYAEELVRSALIFFLDQVDGHLDLDRVREYVRGYLQVRPALAAEVPTAVHRLWWERLTDFWMLTWRYEKQDPRPDPLFPGASALVVWWTHHYDKVLGAFEGSRRYR
jgi:Ser/Thr protein kinase RdoA (MazF antagonist)